MPFTADNATTPKSVQRNITDSQAPLDPEREAGTSQYVRDRESAARLKRPGTAYENPARAAWVTKAWSKEHTNTIHGYSLALPDWLELDTQSSARSRTMRFRDDQIHLTLQGAKQGATPKTLLAVRSATQNSWRAKSAHIESSEFDDDTYTITGRHDDNVFFQRTWVGDAARVTMIWTYPEAEREYMADIVTRSARIFNPGKLSASE